MSEVSIIQSETRKVPAASRDYNLPQTSDISLWASQISLPLCGLKWQVFLFIHVSQKSEKTKVLQPVCLFLVLSLCKYKVYSHSTCSCHKITVKLNFLSWRLMEPEALAFWRTNWNRTQQSFPALDLEIYLGNKHFISENLRPMIQVNYHEA